MAGTPPRPPADGQPAGAGPTLGPASVQAPVPATQGLLGQGPAGQAPALQKPAAGGARSRRERLKGWLPPPLRRRLAALWRRWRRLGQNPVSDAWLTALAEPVRPGLVLCESFHGQSFDCSPRAIAEALRAGRAAAQPDAEAQPEGPLRDSEIRDGAAKDQELEFVLVLRAGAALPPGWAGHPRTRTVVPGSPDHARALAQAGVVLTNSTLPTWYHRRDGQICVNTWHGVPLKRMFELESQARLTLHRNSQRSFLQASHILLPNAFAAEALLGPAGVAGLTGGRVQCLGAPRVDATLAPRGEARAALRAGLGIDPGQIAVFVAPTWRGSLGKVEGTAPELAGLFARLMALDPARFVVFVQLHNFVDSRIGGLRQIPEGMTTNRFMAAADVLISDYSSIIVDFLATGRAVILYPWDRGAYEQARGLNLPLEALPAQICQSPEAVIAALEAPVPARTLPGWEAARALLFPLDDGRATARALAAIRAPAPVLRQSRRRRLLIFAGGFRSNGITTSVLGLLDWLTRYEIDVFVVTEGAPLDADPELQANLRRVPEGVRLLHKAGPMPLLREEQRLLERFHSRNRFEDAAHAEAVLALYRREVRRVIGESTFDVAVDFSGYARYWSLFIAAVPAALHVSWQHNDLRAEADRRFNVLNGVFASYRWYDRLIAVSDETRAVNRAGIGGHYPPGAKALTVRNLILPEEIRAKAAGPLPEGLVFPEDLPVFVMAGRLSPEKAVDRAIRALAGLRRGGQDARLLIMGAGPEAARLAGLIRRLGLGDRVTLAGHVANPFPVIARASCFLLSSDYEGQPMVLLEALTLGRPVIATDIPGARSVLGKEYGHLVPPDVAGVAAGMRHFLEGGIAAASFDAEAYCAAALQDLFDHVLGFTPALRAGPPQDPADG